jgi:hypothetical protein
MLFQDEGQQAGSQSNSQGAPGASNTNTFSLQNASATGGAFTVYGGKYQLRCVATGAGSVTLQVLGPDNATWLTAATAFTASGVEVADLAQGQYRWAVSGLTAVYTAVVRCPQS